MYVTNMNLYLPYVSFDTPAKYWHVVANSCRSDPVVKLSPHSSDVTVSRMSKSTPHPGGGSAVRPPLASSSRASLPGSVLEPLRPAPTSKLNIGAMRNRYENTTDTVVKQLRLIVSEWPSAHLSDWRLWAIIDDTFFPEVVSTECMFVSNTAF